MTTTTDPNALAPLTQIANAALQERVRKVPEFASSSRWGASAIVLQLDEGPGGYETRVGFELRTPLDEPIQTAIIRLAQSKEIAVRETVTEWLTLAFKAAMAIHSNNDPAARLGETVNPALGRVFSWRMAEGPVQVWCESAEETAEVRKDLSARPLFDRLDLAAILPMERDVPLLCLKMELIRPAANPAVPTAPGSRPGAAQGPPVQYECRLNNVDWPAGLEVLKRFHLPKGRPALRVTQYLFFRRTAKSPLKPATPPAAAAAKSAPTSTPKASTPTKKPWWKFW